MTFLTGGVTAPQLRVMYDHDNDGYIHQRAPSNRILATLEHGLIEHNRSYSFYVDEPTPLVSAVNFKYKSDFGDSSQYSNFAYSYAPILFNTTLFNLVNGTRYTWTVPYVSTSELVKIVIVEKHYDFNAITKEPVIPNGYGVNPQTSGTDTRVTFQGLNSGGTVIYSKTSRAVIQNSVPSLSWGYVEKTLYEDETVTLIKNWVGVTNIRIIVENADYTYNADYGVVRDLLIAWFCEAPEGIQTSINATTDNMLITDYAAQDISNYVTSMDWRVGVEDKLQFDASETDAVINLYNLNGMFTDTPIPANRAIIIQAKNGTQWHTLWAGYIESFVPIIGAPVERKAEIRCSTGLFSNTTDVTLGELAPLPVVDMTASSEYISSDSKTSYLPYTYSLGDILLYYLTRASWRANNTLTGFRLNEGRLGETTTLSDLSFFVDKEELTDTVKYVGWLSTYKDMTLRTLLNTVAYTSWAYPLIDRTGRLIFRKNYYVYNFTPNTYSDSLFVDMRYTTGEHVYNVVQVGYTPTDLACADLGIKDDATQQIYKGEGVTSITVDMTSLIVWKAKPFRDENGAIQTTKYELRPNSDTRLEVIPFEGQHILAIHNSDASTSKPYYRNASVVYTSPDNVTWTKTLVRFNKNNKKYKHQALYAWNDNKELTITLPSFAYVDIRRLTAQVLLEREKAVIERANNTLTVQNKTYRIEDTFFTEPEYVEDLADTVLLDFAPKPEYTEVAFYVNNQATIDLLFNEKIGNRIKLQSSFTPIEDTNCHLIIGESHSVRRNTEWRVSYYVRRVEDVV